MSLDTTHPLHHYVVAMVAIVDSIAGSIGHTGAEHNHVGCNHHATEYYKLLSCAQRHPGTYPSDMTVCTSSSRLPPA
ncbi:hypothetical protein Tco_1143394 [Tanacetum coccineum]